MRVYRCGTRESDRKMAREREKCIYAGFCSSPQHTFQATWAFHII